MDRLKSECLQARYNKFKKQTKKNPHPQKAFNAGYKTCLEWIKDELYSNGFTRAKVEKILKGM